MRGASEQWQAGQAGWLAHVALRGVGLALLAAAWRAGLWLALDAGQGGDVIALAVAFAAFAAATSGLVLAALGPELWRHYELPTRYRRFG
jgi:hypothetical protein